LNKYIYIKTSTTFPLL